MSPSGNGNIQVTITNTFGRTITDNNGLSNVQEAIDLFYSGPSHRKPNEINVLVGGSTIAPSAYQRTPLRDGDVVVIREGEFAKKRAVSGA
jgi:hypothetical protein